MPGRLVLCATPIGNLGDAPPRLADELAAAEVAFAEDTRRAAKLLAHLGLEVAVRSFFVGNEVMRADELAERLARGERVALVTDAGTPAVADPGVAAVRAAVDAGAEVSVVPGPSAVTAAIAVAGLGGDRFSFEGFLPRRGRERTERLAAIASADAPVVLFTTGPRVVDDLGELAAVAADREVVVCRELTKLHEEVWRGSLASAASHWSGATRKGEFTVVVAAAPPEPAGSMDDAEESARAAVAAGERRSVAARDAAHRFGVDRGELYDRLVSSDEQA